MAQLMTKWPETEQQKMERMFRLAMALKDEIGLTEDDMGLTDEERYELADTIPGVQDPSWKKLNYDQLHTLLNYMEGFKYILEILARRLSNGQ